MDESSRSSPVWLNTRLVKPERNLGRHELLDRLNPVKSSGSQEPFSRLLSKHFENCGRVIV
jgi:hypothetical protein